MSQAYSAPRSTGPRIGDMTNMTLLLADDDPVFAQRMGAALMDRGFDVRIADSVNAAKAAIRSDPADYAVVDLRLSDGNGLDIVSELHAVSPKSPAIVLSGYGNVAHAVAAVRAGAVDFLPKPADADEVRDALLAPPNRRPPPPEHPLNPAEVRRQHIERILHDCGGNVSETSRRLNMHRRTLQRILLRQAD